MTSPTEPADGRFVTIDAVQARYEGTIPSDRAARVKWRILDVENELIGLVPSLLTLDTDADPETPEGIRVGRVRTLVIDKVLDLYRNPDRKTSKSSGMDGFTTTYGYSQNRDAGPGITFTEEELNRVRLPKKRRPRLGTLTAAPWQVPC
ncbi:MAG: hypothetical protein AB1925_12530 [Actinomycetota bacterium]